MRKNGVVILIVLLLVARSVGAEEIFPRVFAGGVSGSYSLADPDNSDEYRSAGGGLYIHAVGWDRLTTAQKNAARANFSGSDTVVEVGSSTSQANWYINSVHRKGVRAKVVTINAFSSGRIPTVSGWQDLLDYYRSQGVDGLTQLFATFEYANFSSNVSTLPQNKVSDREDFQQIIAISGGLTLDVPAPYFFDREQNYRDWVVDAIKWARGRGYDVMMIASPRSSGVSFHHELEDFVNALAAEGALPNIFAIQNYSTADASSYPNIVGDEDTPYHQLGAAHLMQTHYLPAVVGRSSDADGDGKSNTAEAALGRSDSDPSDFAFDFGSPGNVEGWFTQHIGATTVAGGTFTGTTTSNDPRLINDSIFVDGGRVRSVLVRMKADAAGAVQVYWAASPGGIVADNYMAMAYHTPGEWFIASFNVGNHATWRGRSISALRLDPISVQAAEFSIDWIALSDGDYDRDGISDAAEGFADTDYDGSPDAMDVDSDGDGVADDREGVTGHDRLDPSDMYFGGSSKLSGSSEGWRDINIADFTAGGDVFLAGTAGNNDPQLRRDGFYFNGADVSQVFIRYRAPASATLQLYWGIEGSDIYTSGRATSVRYSTPGEWQTMAFDLSSKVEWISNTITSLRIDPTTVAGSSFEIDYISAGP